MTLSMYFMLLKKCYKRERICSENQRIECNLLKLKRVLPLMLKLLVNHKKRDWHWDVSIESGTEINYKGKIDLNKFTWRMHCH